MRGMFQRDILDEPWRLLVVLVALVAAVALPSRQQHWPVLATAAGISLTGWLARWWKRRGAAAWALTSGTVEAAEVAVEGRGHSLGVGWEVEIAYSYQAQDGWHSGFGRRHFFRRSVAEGYAAKLPGAPVTIRYNPQAPDESVLG